MEKILAWLRAGKEIRGQRAPRRRGRPRWGDREGGFGLATSGGGELPTWVPPSEGRLPSAGAVHPSRFVPIPSPPQSHGQLHRRGCSPFCSTACMYVCLVVRATTTVVVRAFSS